MFAFPNVTPSSVMCRMPNKAPTPAPRCTPLRAHITPLQHIAITMPAQPVQTAPRAPLSCTMRALCAPYVRTSPGLQCTAAAAPPPVSAFLAHIAIHHLGSHAGPLFPWIPSFPLPSTREPCHAASCYGHVAPSTRCATPCTHAMPTTLHRSLCHHLHKPMQCTLSHTMPCGHSEQCRPPLPPYPDRRPTPPASLTGYESQCMLPQPSPHAPLPPTKRNQPPHSSSTTSSHPTPVNRQCGNWGHLDEITLDGSTATSSSIIPMGRPVLSLTSPRCPWWPPNAAVGAHRQPASVLLQLGQPHGELPLNSLQPMLSSYLLLTSSAPSSPSAPASATQSRRRALYTSPRLMMVPSVACLSPP